MASCKDKQPTACSGRPVADYCNKHYLQIRRKGKVHQTSRDTRSAIIDGETARIPLGINAKDGYAIVDKEYAYLADDAWRLTHRGYAIRSRDKKLLHRLILKAKDGQVIDHKDGDPLNNTKQNIRICTQRENAKNQMVKRTSMSGVKGVYKKRDRYVARIRNDYRFIHIGVFDTIEEASKAYNQMALRLHGDFARLNNV